jgi:hypothetical protein
MQFPHMKCRMNTTRVCFAAYRDANLTLALFSSKISRVPAVWRVSGEIMSLELDMSMVDGNGEVRPKYIAAHVTVRQSWPIRRPLINAPDSERDAALVRPSTFRVSAVTQVRGLHIDSVSGKSPF